MVPSSFVMTSRAMLALSWSMIALCVRCLTISCLCSWVSSDVGLLGACLVFYCARELDV
jgi:hypothetical protein